MDVYPWQAAGSHTKYYKLCHCIEYAVVHSLLLVSKRRVGRVIACTAKIFCTQRYARAGWDQFKGEFVLL